MKIFKKKILDTRISISPDVELTGFMHHDRANLIRFLNDESVAQNTLTIPAPYTEKDAAEWFKFVADVDHTLGWQTNWAIRHRTEGCIGGIGVFAKNGKEGHLDEIGYWLAQPFRGMGLMTETVRQFTEFQFFTRPALVRLQAFVFSHNPASMRVLEKAGYQYEGLVRKLYKKNGQLIDGVLFGFVL